MDEARVTLTVFFEGPFWVGIFERVFGGRLTVSKVTFGAEPKDCEVWDFVLKHYGELRFSPPVEAGVRRTADNPKRSRRSAKRQLNTTGIGTKSQQALQMQREEQKTTRKQASKEQRDAEKQRRFDLKRQKHKERHKGH